MYICILKRNSVITKQRQTTWYFTSLYCKYIYYWIYVHLFELENYVMFDLRRHNYLSTVINHILWNVCFL